MDSDDHFNIYLTSNFLPAPSVIYYPVNETFVNLGYLMVIFMDISVKNMSRKLAGDTGKAHPLTGHKVPEWGTGKALEMTTSQC